MKDHLEPCPSCGSARVLPIVYGEPSAEGQPRIDRGEAVMGGCMLSGDGSDPAFACQVCGGRFGVLAWNRVSEKGEAGEMTRDGGGLPANADEPSSDLELDQSMARAAANWRRLSDVYQKYAPSRVPNLQSYEDWTPFALGLLARTHYVLESIMLLEQRGPDCAVLARVFIEHVITFAWLMKSPFEHYQLILRSETILRGKIFADMHKAEAFSEQDLAENELSFAPLRAVAAAKPMPELPDRAEQADTHWSKIDPEHGWRFRMQYAYFWRSYGGFVHPTWTGVVPFLDADKEAISIGLVARPLDTLDTTALCSALFHDALIVAGHALGWPPRGEVDDAFYVGIAGQDAKVRVE